MTTERMDKTEATNSNEHIRRVKHHRRGVVSNLHIGTTPNIILPALENVDTLHRTS